MLYLVNSNIRPVYINGGVIGRLDALRYISQDNIDILAISETKVDQSITNDMLNIDGYSLPYRRDRDINGGVLVYV